MKKEHIEEIDTDDGVKSYIQIDKDLRLALSPRNWQLQRKSIAGEESKEPGKITYNTFNWFTSLESALKTIHRNKLAKEKFTTIEQMVAANNKVIKHITKVFEPVFKDVK